MFPGTRISLNLGAFLLVACGTGAGPADTVSQETDPVRAGSDNGPSAPLEAPVASDLLLVGTEDSTLVVAKTPNETVEILTGPTHGQALQDNGELIYIPQPRWNGFDSFTYRLTNAAGEDEGSVDLTIYGSLDGDAPQVLLPQLGLRRADLGVVMNGEDPRSIEVGQAYADLREIPPENLVVIDVPTETTTLTPEEFAPLYVQVHETLPVHVQAIAVAWTEPWRVGCMSITSALALGYADGYCYADVSDGGCQGTTAVPTYLSESSLPWDDHGVRPAMMLAGETPAEVSAMVERGLAADRTNPTGTAYMVRTSDPFRNVRWPQMVSALLDWEGVSSLQLSYLDNSDGDPGADSLVDAKDVLFYFTGLPTVPSIDTHTYLPGALADHLTSLGGQLTTSSQMSVLRWLEAGATASYGAVVEPCNLLDKFPNVRFVLQLYTRGETALEAYWKSVKTPGEGVFVGDPLSNPWGRHLIRWTGGTLEINTPMLRPGQSLRVETADRLEGPFTVLLEGLTAADLGPLTVTLENAHHAVYRVLRDSSL